MLKKAIDTIKKNPKILLGFAVLVIAGLLLAFPFYRSIVLTILGDYSRIDEVPDFREVVRTVAIVSPFVYMILGVFVLPPLYSYVYEAITGEKKIVWSKKSFFKYSWRIVARTVMAFFTLFAAFIVLFLFFVVPNLGFILYTAALSAWCVFWVISLTSVAVEDRFIDSLPNTFFVGRRYYFKMYLVSFVTMLPAIVLSTWFMIYFHSVGMDIAYAVPAINGNPILIVTVFLLLTLSLSIYYVFAQAFIFTYSMHCYLAEREKMNEEDRLKEQNQDKDEQKD